MKIYFDGLCLLCSTEIAHYRRLPEASAVKFIDISSPDFDAASEGLDPRQIHREMHVRDQEGRVHTGVDAFICIWSFFPRYRLAARAARLPIVRALLAVGYSVFARVRPWLPRRRLACSGPHCEIPVKRS